MSGYGKVVLAIAGAVLLTVQAALDPFGLGQAGVTLAEGVLIGEAFLGALLVHLVPNLDRGVAKYTKLVVYGALAVLGILVGALADGFTGHDVVTLVIAFLVGAGVLQSEAPQHPAVVTKDPATFRDSRP